MSIETYAELKTAVASWLNRTDLTSQIPDFIRLAEQRIYYGSDAPYQSAPLRIPAMEANTTGSITAGTIAFPTRFLEPISLAVTSGNTTWDMDYVTPKQYRLKSNDACPPSFYTYRNGAIYTAGTGAADYDLDYYESFALLSADADTNWILENSPGLLLYGALVESAPFLRDDDRVGSWFGMFKAALSAVNRSANRQGGTLVVRAG